MTSEYDHKSALDPLHTDFVEAAVKNPSFYANRFSQKRV